MESSKGILTDIFLKNKKFMLHMVAFPLPPKKERCKVKLYSFLNSKEWVYVYLSIFMYS